MRAVLPDDHTPSASAVACSGDTKISVENGGELGLEDAENQTRRVRQKKVQDGIQTKRVIKPSVRHAHQKILRFFQEANGGSKRECCFHRLPGAEQQVSEFCEAVTACVPGRVGTNRVLIHAYLSFFASPEPSAHLIPLGHH